MKNKIILFMILISTLLLSGCSDSYFLVDNPKDTSGNLEVSIQDQHTEIIDLKLSQFLDNITLLDNYNIDDKIINISTTGHIPVNDDLICLKENKSFYQGHVVNVVSIGGNNYTITLDKPLDFDYSIIGGCSIRNGNWAVNGAITPITFYVSPFRLNNVSWDITRVILVCIGDGISGADPTPDLTSFFVTDPITNGIVLRSVNGVTKNIFSAIDNFHLIGETYDLSFFDASKFGLYGASTRRTFSGPEKNGVTIRLDSETSDKFELIIQDDLTDMDDCHAIAQGHVVER